jgi:hypothetical protein
MDYCAAAMSKKPERPLRSPASRHFLMLEAGLSAKIYIGVYFKIYVGAY